MSARNPDRRIPRSAALRRLIAAGNLLAAAACGGIKATPDLAATWDNAVEELRADLAEPRAIPCRVPGCTCPGSTPRCTS
ncbi:MAG TPA: hypothetical protein VJ396_07050 [Acidiferrobacterales bacterium]|nr:hypothetical protein [Acidiferrobacterales bacterium]